MVMDLSGYFSKYFILKNEWKSIPKEEIVVSIESVIKDLPTLEANKIRMYVAHTIRHVSRLKLKLDIPKETRKSLRNLNKRKFIAVLKADKGRGIVCVKNRLWVENFKFAIATNSYKILDKDSASKIAKIPKNLGS